MRTVSKSGLLCNSVYFIKSAFCLYINTEVYVRCYDLTSCLYLFLCTECRIIDWRYLRTRLCKALVRWIVSPVWLACDIQLFLGHSLEHFFLCGLHWSESRSNWLSEGRWCCCLKELSSALAKSKYNKTARVTYSPPPPPLLLLCFLFNFWHNEEEILFT